MARVPAISACCAAAAAAVLCVGGATAARGSATPHGLTLYTVATDVQFINTADDRARGAKNNPFSSSQNKLQPKVADKGDGPFPGDVVVFDFDLYGKLPTTKTIGSASYTCYFNYVKHALCQAYYQLAHGALTAAGPVDFSTTSFTLVVTGGTKGYLAARGQVSSAQATGKAQRVEFQLLP